MPAEVGCRGLFVSSCVAETGRVAMTPELTARSAVATTAGLALQLQVPFEVAFLGPGLMASAPDGPRNDESRFDLALS